MRSPYIAGYLVLLTLTGPARSAPTDSANLNLAYPAEVALSDEGERGFVFRRFPGSQRLYTYDLDRAGESTCKLDCIGARPPVIAPPNAKSVGDWQIIKREDGLRQWAYKGKPIYTLFHDDPSTPQGDGEGGVWHLLPYMKKN